MGSEATEVEVEMALEEEEMETWERVEVRLVESGEDVHVVDGRAEAVIGVERREILFRRQANPIRHGGLRQRRQHHRQRGRQHERRLLFSAQKF